jgi:dolichol-phosphate mannosyltransferase
MDKVPNPELSVVLPAYLEEENLRVLLPRLSFTLIEMGVSYEIIVVDTRPPMDHTPNVCRENSIRYIQRRGSNSFGSAVRTGIDEAKGRRIIFMDADGSHTPEFVPQLYQRAHEADVIIASRYVQGGATENTPVLIFMSLILNFTYALVLGLKCKDVSNSFKIYRAEQLKELELTCENFDIVEEILYKLRVLNKGFSIIEVPFVFKKRIFGETKRNLVTFVLTYLITILKLRFSPARRKREQLQS